MICILREEGQGLVEYALILILIAVAIVITMSLLGEQLGVFFSQVTDKLNF